MKKYKRDKRWYEEISFGILQIVKIGKSYGFIIPKRYFDKETVNYLDKGIVILLKRRRGVSDEFSKEELVQFERFKNLKEKERKAMEKAIESLGES